MYRIKLRLHGRDVRDVALESGREYTFGRGADCDVQLEEQAGISRLHFRVIEVDGLWQVEVLSKFGDITHAGSPIQNMNLEVGTVFKLAGYDFLFAEAAVTASVPIAAGQSDSGEMVSNESEFNSEAPFEGSSPNLPARIGPSDFEGSDEATKIITAASTGVPYIRVTEASGREETIKLDGRKWVAGREEGSQILLNDRKASRRQFELMASPQGNFIRDLGSANGTLLNGMPLAADELKPIRSGDVIQVGGLTVHFEVRDPHFERRLQVVSKEVLSAVPQAPQAAPYEMINYPVPSGPGGAVRMDASQGNVPGHYDGAHYAEVSHAGDARKKKIRFYAIAAIVIAIVVALLTQEPPAPPKIKQSAPTVSDGFSKLTPQKQQQVKELMVLGRNLYMQGKQALAAEQLRKLHEILPEGYDNSIAIAAECADQEKQEQRRKEVERELKQAAENTVRVDENLRKCERVANSTTNENELKSCLAPTYELDPSNSKITDYLNRIRARASEREAKLAGQKDYANRVAKGRALFAAAEAVEARGDADGSVEAYRKHLTSNYPDPDNLKAKSVKKVGAIELNKAALIKKYLEAAQLAFTNSNYSAAVTNINKLKAIDPRNEAAAELNASIQKVKNQKLREIYEESVISEGLGQIDLAKANWKKILEMDHPDGEYYKRARSKMKAFGGG